jgi:hypothetical protein
VIPLGTLVFSAFLLNFSQFLLPVCEGVRRTLSKAGHNHKSRVKNTDALAATHAYFSFADSLDISFFIITKKRAFLTSFLLNQKFGPKIAVRFLNTHKSWQTIVTTLSM